MNAIELKKNIGRAITTIGQSDLTSASLSLFDALGYPTKRQAPFAQKTANFFIENYANSPSSIFDTGKALTDDWKYVDLLFQLTKADVSTQQWLFDTGRVDNTIMESYLFFAVELFKENYSRGVLARITREINKVFPMPVMVLFRHGTTFSLSIIDRRLNKKDDMKDVLEKKVTLIKDIRLSGTHRAHIEILADLSLGELQRKFPVRNFVELHNAWRATLDISALNKKFYQELSNWYFWAMGKVRFPDDLEKDEEIRNATNLIRLITRIIFVWFIREKQLVADGLFNQAELTNILKGFGGANANTYYPAILQNLFFGTLNQKMDERGFAEEGGFDANRKQYGVKNLYRHAELFQITKEKATALYKDVPFLNGGLFDCLDKEDEQDHVQYVDGFSRNPKKQAFVPDFLFFSEEQEVDLNGIYGTKGKSYKVKGLIDILSAYKFTIAENTPVEEEVALDPELLGKVFENLLASYNPETRTTARNKTGSFYTPREIVEYMVDESLKGYLRQKLIDDLKMKEADAEAGLDILLMYTEKSHAFSDAERDALIAAIDSLKILDPACGSGAFPMGILHKLVYILHKLDPGNELWKQRQIAKAQLIDDSDIRGRLLDDIEQAFANNELDYGRKLYLIENCIFGVDIQPIAVQIAKLRFFISLVIDQNRKADKENHGIRSLPNLETKFVAADSLIALKADFSDLFHEKNLLLLEDELKGLRHRYFAARNRKEKLGFQVKDREIRGRIVETLTGMIANRNTGIQQQITHLEKKISLSAGKDRAKWVQELTDLKSKIIDPATGNDTAMMLSRFDPYDQNASAPFFDPEWMFGCTGGFDVVIGNPPYVQIQNFSGKSEQARWEAQGYKTYAKTGDVYCLFYERGFGLLSPGGRLCYITSNKWMRAGYGKKMRSFFLQNGSLCSVIDFGDSPIFENATTYTNIALWNRQHSQAAPQAFDLSRVYDAGVSLPELLATQGKGQALFTEESFVIAAGAQAEVKRRIEEVGTPLKDWDIQIYRGILTGLNEAFIIDQAKYDELVAADPKSAEILKPILRGRDIKRYKAEWAGLYVVASHNGYRSDGKDIPSVNLPKEYPAVYAYLVTVGKGIADGVIKVKGKGLFERDDQGENWWNLRDCAYWQEFRKEKIVYSEIVFDSAFFFDNSGITPEATAFIMTGDNPRFLTAILNSRPVTAIFKKFYAGGDLRGDTFRYKKVFIELLPIPKISLGLQKPYEVLVDSIQFARAHDLGPEAEVLEAVVDVMVYGLYFEPDMKAAGCYINHRIAEVVKPFKDDDTDEFKAAYVKKLADFCQKDSVVYTGLIQSRTVAVVNTILGGDKK